MHRQNSRPTVFITVIEKESMAHYTFQMPVDEAQVRQLRINDTVTLEQTLFGIRDATQIHLFDRGRTPNLIFGGMR